MDDNEVQALTNIQEISDFYEFTEDCLESIKRIEVPSLSSISHLVFNLPFEEELKSIFSL